MSWVSSVKQEARLSASDSVRTASFAAKRTPFAARAAPSSAESTAIKRFCAQYSRGCARSVKKRSITVVGFKMIALSGYGVSLPFMEATLEKVVPRLSGQRTEPLTKMPIYCRSASPASGVTVSEPFTIRNCLPFGMLAPVKVSLPLTVLTWTSSATSIWRTALTVTGYFASIARARVLATRFTASMAISSYEAKTSSFRLRISQITALIFSFSAIAHSSIKLFFSFFLARARRVRIVAGGRWNSLPSSAAV